MRESYGSNLVNSKRLKKKEEIDFRIESKKIENLSLIAFDTA